VCAVGSEVLMCVLILCVYSVMGDVRLDRSLGVVCDREKKKKEKII
jgi:hypothetical protein